MSMSREHEEAVTLDLKESLERAAVDVWMPAYYNSPDKLPPYLWERLRLKLQAIFRRATGEEYAILIVDNNDPAQKAS